ncbi:P-loop containing nucleoside triphosphate hydrolase protein [Sistotremastrum niveocremeum HHB9708]|uniref:p-loop containing nucleoside triphosphate hydrolase protein n=1 Tax=Sistotremastrum niveocremeum HHB9708 TaxID=1314777 RepID=A0A165AKD7_9AGAM|nr:P-loop containing nucleoside triphosphate hydrolase protein [Sistotremastrum niveocremeum HHB9708]
MSGNARGKRKKGETSKTGRDEDASGSQGPPVKKARSTSVAKDKGKEKATKTPWPEYFNELYKIFKALNTVLAFCSSRKQLATTFPVVRSSVEALLKQPLDLQKVAELKALLPDVIKFAYIPQNELRVHESSQKRSKSPDYGSALTPRRELQGFDDNEHVLVLDFIEVKPKAKKLERLPVETLIPSPALTPAGVKKLIEIRNQRFETAVEELLQAAAECGETPDFLVQGAAREHIPVNPSTIKALASTSQTGPTQHKVPSPEERRSISEIIEELQNLDWYKEQIISRRTTEAREPTLGHLDTSPSENIMKALEATRNIDSFYSHQAEAINSLAKGSHVIVSTSTASGKSVIYQVPVLMQLERDRHATAIFVYPTKALAQDQKVAFQQLASACVGLEDLQVHTYDGDTPQDQRAGIRDNASVIFTNFDMIHASILPHEDNWRRFLKNLKIFAVDELHYYTGLLGSHVAFIMRRFRRVCAAVGNRHARFVSCSATISNPRQHMKNIFGVDDIDVITNDGAPSGPKDFVIWNPPLVDLAEPSLGRESTMLQATALMRYLMKNGIRTIMFCKIRKVCELAMKTLRTELTSEGRLDILEKVMAYRGGYSQSDRRRIEREAFGGHLLGIVATNALELGVDIGTLDAVIMLGFPFNVASMRQQSGRAGRRSRDALAILVTDSTPTDQHYVQYPDDLFSARSDDLVVELEGRAVLESHLQCAAHEMPLSDEDAQYFGELFHPICESQLVRDKQGWYHPNPKFLPHPAKHVSIRGVEEERYTVIDVTNSQTGGAAGSKILEEIEFSRALFETYEGGFIHQGLTYIVREVSHDDRIAKLVRSDVNWTTKPRDFTDIDAAQTYRIKCVQGSPYHTYYGRVEIQTIVFGFFKLRGSQILDTVFLETPPFHRETMGWWVDIPRNTLNVMRSKGINAAEAIHAAEHAIMNCFAMQQDIKTECKVAAKEYRRDPSERKRPARLIFYDAQGQGSVAAARAFDHGWSSLSSFFCNYKQLPGSALMQDALERTEACDCENGCLRCTKSTWCKEGNEVSSKVGALIVLRSLLDLPLRLDEIPDAPYLIDPLMETVVEATQVRALDDIEVEPTT